MAYDNAETKPGPTWANQDRPLTTPHNVPGCAYGAITRQALDDLRDNLHSLDLKINLLLVSAIFTLLFEIWRDVNR